MSVSNSHISKMALTWVRSSSETIMHTAAKSLEKYAVENDEEGFRSSLVELQELNSVLKIVGVPNTSKLIQEVLRTSAALLNGSVQREQDAFRALMHVFAVIPNYLDIVYLKGEEITEALIPSVNELRYARGQKTVPMRNFLRREFDIDDFEAKPAHNAISIENSKTYSYSDIVKAVRRQYMVGMLVLLKGKDEKDGLRRLMVAFDSMHRLATHKHTMLLWSTAKTFVKQLQDIGLGSDRDHQATLYEVLPQFEQAMNAGSDEAFAEIFSRDLLVNLLVHIAIMPSNISEAADIRNIFRNNELIGDPTQIRSAWDKLRQPASELMKTIAEVSASEIRSAIGSIDRASKSKMFDETLLEEISSHIYPVRSALSVINEVDLLQYANETVVSFEKLSSSPKEDHANLAPELAQNVIVLQQQIDAWVESFESSINVNVAAALKHSISELKNVQKSLKKYFDTEEFEDALNEIPQSIHVLSGVLNVCGLPDESMLGKKIAASMEVVIDEARRDEADEDEMPQLADAIIILETAIDSRLRQTEIDADLYQRAINDIDAFLTDKGVSLTKDKEKTVQPERMPTVEQAVEQEPAEIVADEPLTVEVEATHEEPEVIEPEAVEPEAVEPESVEPEAVEPEAVEPEAVEPEATPIKIEKNEDDEIVTMFKKDCESRIGKIVAIASDSEQYYDVDKLRIIKQQLHTIKGDAGIMGFTGAEKVATTLKDEIDASVKSNIPLNKDQASIVVKMMNAFMDKLKSNGLRDLEEAEELLTLAGFEQWNNLDDAEQTPVAAVVATTSGELNYPEGTDEDIAECFEEEFADEIVPAMEKGFDAWPDGEVENTDVLLEVRAKWHTTKGSGRMANALNLGDFAQSIEYMYNAVRDGQVKMTPEHKTFGQLSLDIAKDLVNTFKYQAGQFSHGALEVKEAADKFAEGVVPDVDALRAWCDTVPGSSDHSVESEPVINDKPVADQPDEPITSEDSEAERIERLQAVYKAELETHLKSAREFIAAARNDKNLSPNGSLVRAFHTIKGTSGTVQNADAFDLAGSLEAQYEYLSSVSCAPLSEMIDLTEKALLAIENSAENLGKNPVIDNKDDMISTLESLASDSVAAAKETEETPIAESETPSEEEVETDFSLDLNTDESDDFGSTLSFDSTSSDNDSLELLAGSFDLGGDNDSGLIFEDEDEDESPSPLAVESAESAVSKRAPVSEFDTELYDDVFEDEAKEGIDQVYQAFGKLYSDPTDEDALNDVRRVSHTIKGAARMCGLNPIGDLLHEAENLMQGAVENTITSDTKLIDLMSEVYDSIEKMMESAGSNQPVHFNDLLFVKLHKVHASGDVNAADSVTMDDVTDDILEEQVA